jgi:hypothetical protein
MVATGRKGNTGTAGLSFISLSVCGWPLPEFRRCEDLAGVRIPASSPALSENDNKELKSEAAAYQECTNAESRHPRFSASPLDPDLGKESPARWCGRPESNRHSVTRTGF